MTDSTPSTQAAATPSRSLSRRQIARAALVVSFGFLTSGLLGLLRTAIISGTFGTSNALDAFYAAGRIPETLFTLVAGGALGSSFIPVFARLRSSESEQDAWRLASAALTLVVFAATILSALMFLLAPLIVPTLLVPGKAPDVQTLTLDLTRVMLLTTIIFGASGLCMAILNANQRFFLPALAPSMYNLGIIFGALVLTALLPPVYLVDELLTGSTLNPTATPSPNPLGLAFGAILGAALHLGVQLPGLRRLLRDQGVRLLFNLRTPWRTLWQTPGLREVLALMGPRVLGLGVVQINFIVNVAFSSGMAEGSLVALNTAWFLMFFALGVIGQGVGSAVFPSLTALRAENDMEGFKDRLAGAMRGVLFLAFPASIALILLGEAGVAVLFQRGEWTAESTAATAWALAFYALGIPGFALLEILSRAFYALEDTWTPVKIGILSMVSNIVLSIIFIQFIGIPGDLVRGPFAGLALANALTTLLEAAVLWWLLRRRVGGLRDGEVIGAAWRVLVAALVMGAAIWLVIQIGGDAPALVIAILASAVGGAVFFALALLLGVSEARTIPALVLQRVKR